jgi:hypothetical protein
VPWAKDANLIWYIGALDEPQVGWVETLAWIAEYRIGDLASIAGVLIALVGFGLTLRGVRKTKSAAQSAAIAAEVTRNSIRRLDTVVDFSAAITILDEIKRLHRGGQWMLLPEPPRVRRRPFGLSHAAMAGCSSMA